MFEGSLLESAAYTFGPWRNESATTRGVCDELETRSSSGEFMRNFNCEGSEKIVGKMNENSKIFHSLMHDGLPTRSDSTRIS